MDPRLQLIFSRRSVRSYTGEKIEEDDIHSLLEAAMAAPSAGNSKPWHFVAVTEADKLEALSEAHQYGKMLPKAALAITVCGDPSLSTWWVQDCTAATENLLIAAAGLSLGAVWLGIHNNPERENAVRAILGIPDTIGVLSLISLGHPSETPEPRTQFDAGRVHRGEW